MRGVSVRAAAESKATLHFHACPFRPEPCGSRPGGCGGGGGHAVTQQHSCCTTNVLDSEQEQLCVCEGGAA